MSINRPRRIFRGSKRGANRAASPVVRPAVRRTVMACLAGAAGGAALLLVSLSSDLFGRVPPGPSEVTAPPSQVIVIDGETLRLGATIIHLSDLAAPARGEACAAGPDCGSQATAALAGLVRDLQITCQIGRHDLGGRPLARCQAGGRDINAALVALGWARALSQELDVPQSEARAHRRGMWLAG